MKKREFSVWPVFLAVILITVTWDLFATPPKNAQTRKREKVVAAMRGLADVRWIPSEDLTYWNPKFGVIFKAGNEYHGLPYTQRNRETPLEKFRDNLDSDGRYVGPADYMGTDCSSSVCLAWREIDRDLPCLSTYLMFPGMGKIVTVGNYKVTSTESTPLIIADNKAETIRDCYAQVQPGDVILWREDGLGHVRMVSGIDPEKETVTIIEQTGVNGKGEFKEGGGTWRVDYPFTYDQLIESGYIPITHEALVK